MIARNETLHATRHDGSAFWNPWAGHHIRSWIEAKTQCLKVFGDCIAARHPDCQTADIEICFNALGIAEIIRRAGSHRGKGLSCCKREFCSNALMWQAIRQWPGRARLD